MREIVDRNDPHIVPWAYGQGFCTPGADDPSAHAKLVKALNAHLSIRFKGPMRAEGLGGAITACWRAAARAQGLSSAGNVMQSRIESSVQMDCDVGSHRRLRRKTLD